MLINKAFLKYGYSKFKLEIIEYCDKSNLLNREQYYIDLLNPEYNILKIAGSAIGYKHTKEAIEKIRKAGLGRSRDKETKKKISATLKTFFSENEKARGTMAKIGALNGKKVKIQDLSNNSITEYTSYSKAAIALNTSQTTISNYVKNGKPFKNRFIITIVE